MSNAFNQSFFFYSVIFSVQHICSIILQKAAFSTRQIFKITSQIYFRSSMIPPTINPTVNFNTPAHNHKPISHTLHLPFQPTFADAGRQPSDKLSTLRERRAINRGKTTTATRIHKPFFLCCLLPPQQLRVLHFPVLRAPTLPVSPYQQSVPGKRHNSTKQAGASIYPTPPRSIRQEQNNSGHHIAPTIILHLQFQCFCVSVCVSVCAVQFVV